MNRFIMLSFFVFLSIPDYGSNQDPVEDVSVTQFQTPDLKSGPYVWWHWLGYNVTREGIRKDFEAMKSAGIAGATMFQITSTATNRCAPIKNVYSEGVTYFNDRWWDLLRFSAAEAKKNGIELGMHNCAGWSVSGGPWITPEKSMQKVVWSEQKVAGPSRFDGVLFQPQNLLNYYRDIAVLLVPNGEPSAEKVVDISSKMHANGRLICEIPDGEYTIYRFGHTTTGKSPAPLPEDIVALESDKMSAGVMTFHMEHVLEPLKHNLGEFLGNTFKHLLFDSYEAGDQNWTPKMKSEFLQRRGYDITPWLPVFAGRVIGSKDLTNRFKRDLKTAISDMFVEYSYTLPHKMINKLGMQMQIEPYGSGGECPFNTNDAAPVADIPMTEFWSHQNKGGGGNVAAAARPFGVNIYGAEAFTGSPEYSRWNETPAKLKPAGDGAFANGVNRLILHHWIHQPFPDNIKPGMSMGRWGTHFGRNQTWYEPGKSWITYLTRCQYLLQKGAQVADFIALDQFIPGGDLVSENTFLNFLKVINGKIVSPCGRTYALIALPKSKTMSVAVARKIKEFVSQGAVVFGPKPGISAGLKNHTENDKTVETIGNELWGKIDSALIKENTYGSGKVIWGCSLAEALSKVNVKPDLILTGENVSTVLWHHRLAGSTDIYYISNSQAKSIALNVSFRIRGKQPEIWNPETGEISTAAVWHPTSEGCELRMNLNANQDAFLIFKNGKIHTSFVQEFKTLLPDSLFDIEQTSDGNLIVKSGKPGKFELLTTNGMKSTAVIESVPSGQPIKGTWAVTFKPALGKPFTATFEKLASWSLSDNENIKYFSGTAICSNRFSLPESVINEHISVKLNAGSVKDMASVSVNGKFIAVLWHAPFELDITRFVKKGENTIAISVTNTWVNRMIGDNRFPDDCEWGTEVPVDKKTSAGRSLSSIPEWLMKGVERPSKQRVTFSSWNYFTKESTLVESGLLGEVKLDFQKSENFK